ncbi:TolC family protein [Pedobacter sp. MC2016-24]|uniref:TolC family protein n=1 Tax=Pedobacter sp. MC2016-24 TaxID=2780090 RepID=UPI001881A7EA|nr:TolC family protein [Pedobacter sp. MC2016-24]MBE9601584.1 TolC family protein [Pedobacter sp. MC2016-24]
MKVNKHKCFRGYIMAVVLLLVIKNNAIAQTILPLEQALKMAMENSKRLKADSLQYGIAQSRVTQAEHANLPQLSITSSYQRVSSNITPFNIQMPTGSFSINPQLLNQSFNAVQLNQSLFSGGKNAYNKKSLQRESEASRYDIEAAQISLQKQVLEMWYGLYNATKSAYIIETNISTLQERKKDMQTLLKQGLVLENDVLKIDLAMSNLQNTLAEVKANKAILNDNLCIATGLGENTLITITDAEIGKLPVKPEQSRDEKLWLNRPELRGFSRRVESAAYRTKSIRADYLPTLGLFATFNVDNPNQRVIPSVNKFYPTALAGIRLNWNISSLYTNGARVRESKLAEQQLLRNSEQASDQIQSEVKASLHQVSKTLEKLGLVQKQLEQAKENYRVEQNKLKEQVTTPTDFLEANSILLQAELNLATAQANNELAVYNSILSKGNLLFFKKQ